MKKKVFVLMISLIVILGVVGTSYSYLKAERVSSTNTGLTLSNFGVILLTDMTNISIPNTYPMLDSEGLTNNKTTFQVKNTGNIIASYKVSLVDKEGVVSTLKNTDVRYQLKRTSDLTGETTTLDIKNLDNEGLIDTGNIEVGETFTYELIMWIDYNANPNGLSFSKVVLVEGMQIASLDQSGANFPELTDNMIPIYYDQVSDTEGVWRVADRKNLNENYKWFDYSEYMWANVATVHKDKMDDYYGYSGSEVVTTSDFPVNIETNEEAYVAKQVSTYTSGNKNIHSTTSSHVLTFTTSSKGTLTFDYSVSSESGYDKLTITLNDGSTTTTLVSAISGTSSGSKEVSLTASTAYTLTASYTKDGSSNLGDDQATISNINITSTLSTPLVESLDATYPWSATVGDTTFEVSSYTPANKQLASSTYTYDEATGIFTLENPTETVYTSASQGLFTCNSNTKTTCVKLYEIKTLDANNVVTSVDIHTGSNRGEFGSVLGQEVKMEDITTMWVWIPRYKYIIWSGNNESSIEQLIDVEFEHGIDSTGTVKCTDNIQTASDSASSETCTDSTYGSIINGKSTYTHPAFTFGSEELTGFWMAKFEISTDDETCLTSQSTTNCNKTGLNILIKPNEQSLRYITVSNIFANIRGMETYNNIHGFTQSEKATTWLDSNSYLTGDIKNDSNKIDTHMLKNMEWGAVTYLSQSQYGKWSNPLYTGDYRRVYKNNYYSSSSSIYYYKTGYSSGTYNGGPTTSTSSTFLYNDMTIATEGRGYRGAGASTTGTVYGVYDMNGGAYDYVMANMVNTSGAFYPANSGTWSTATSGNIPNTKYYDKYSYNGSQYSINSQSRGKLGDATKEATTTFGSQTGGWGGVYRIMPCSSRPWLSRGGNSSNSSDWGVAYSNGVNGALNYSSGRPALVVSREFPWLSE